jgi:ATP-dependent Clp protease ATP-binding subunit ClpA
VVLRLNQYKHPNDVFTLLGPPPGMPGYEVGGALTRPVLENPQRVIILDELEKAHPDIHHCLYDILDAALCREKSSNRIVDFSSCVFFATSNAGVEPLRALRERNVGASEWLGRSRDALVDEGGFDKAFLARWGGIYLLDELPPIHVAEVACLQLAKYWREYGIDVTFTAPEIILEAVMRNEQFRQYGVRQIGAFIQGVTGDAIARARTRGASQVRLEVDGSLGLVVKEAVQKQAGVR